MKNLINILFILLLVSSCSNKDSIISPEINDGEEDKTAEIIPLKLELEEAQKNIFEYAVFSLYPDKIGIMFSLIDVYDSITWEVTNLDGSLKVFKHTEGSAKFTHQWSHNFYKPGKYTTYLLGYKNNKVINSDTVQIEITNTKDFLCYNWKDIKEPGEHSTGYIDVLNYYEFVTYADMHQGIPSVTVHLIDKKKDARPGFFKLSKNILIDYINSLYAISPTFNETDNNLLEKYNDLFIYKKENNYPLCIWITQKSRIALIKDETFNEYQLYAEPN